MDFPAVNIAEKHEVADKDRTWKKNINYTLN